MHEPNGLTPKFNVGDRATVKQIVRSHIRSWMEQTGSQKKAAPILGIKAGSLSRKISKEKIKYIKNAHHEPETDQSSAQQDWQDSRTTSDDAAGSTDD